MSGTVGILLIVGAIIGAAYLFINACKIDFMKFACGNKGSAQMQAISKKIQDQFDFTPGTPAHKAAKAELDSIKNRPTFLPGQTYKADYTMVNSGRIAI